MYGIDGKHYKIIIYKFNFFDGKWKWWVLAVCGEFAEDQVRSLSTSMLRKPADRIIVFIIF